LLLASCSLPLASIFAEVFGFQGFARIGTFRERFFVLKGVFDGKIPNKSEEIPKKPNNF